MESVQVEIFGNIYSIKGAADKAHIMELASFLDAKMHEVQKATGTAEPLRVAILSALTIADELYRLKAEYSALEKSSDTAVQRLLRLTGSSNDKEG